MQTNTALKKTNSKTAATGRVYLIPLNEGHEIAYCEGFTGTESEIFDRTKEILDSLSKLFPTGTWVLKIEESNGREAIYVDLSNIYNEDFEVLGNNHGNNL